MAEDIARNARDYVLLAGSKRSEALDIAQDTASKIESRDVTLFEVVRSLGEYINHDDTAIRAKATDYFSQVINRLAPDSLSAQHAQVVCTFLCSRMEDGGAISGIAALQRQRAFNDEMAVMTLRAMVACSEEFRRRPQDQRFRAVQILHKLMAAHRLALKDLGPESATGFLELVNAEKDPRILMTIFSILEVIIAEWDIAPLTEALFDAVFCYFPITFKPPPNDPYGITAADLKIQLRQCIAASPFFAQHAFPQLIDKLDSTSMNAKRDVLQALKACTSSYDPATLSNYTVFLWDSLKFEIFNSQDDELADETIETLKSIVECLHDDGSGIGPSATFSGFLGLVTKECLDRLKEPQQKQARSAIQIVSGLASTSPEAYAAIVRDVVPQLIKQYKEAGSIEERLAILEPISRIVRSAPVSPVGTPQKNTDRNPLAPFKDDLLSICTAVLSSPRQETISLQAAALRCLSSVCALGNVLAPVEAKTAVHHFNGIILKQGGSPDSSLKEEAIQGLRSVSRFLPDLIVDETFPTLISRISVADGSSDFETYCANLECLASISVGEKFCDTLVRRLLSRLADAVQQGVPVENIQALLSTINYVLATEIAGGFLRGLDYYPRLLELVAFVTNAATGQQALTSLNAPEAILGLGRLALTIIKGVDDKVQEEVVRQVYTLFEKDDVFISQPIDFHVSEPRRRTIILSTYFLGAVRIELVPPRSRDEWRALLAAMTDPSIRESSAPVRRGLLQHICLIVGKILPADALDVPASILWELSGRQTEGSPMRANSVRVIFSLARALLWRFYEVDPVLGRLNGLLEDPVVGTEAGRGFELLLAPDEVVCEENGANIEPFAKQRIFGVSLPIIAAKVRGTQATKANYLLALSGMLKHIDTSMLFGETEIILPPLLQILDLDFGDAKESTVRVLTIMLQEDPAALEEHAASLVNRLLKIAVGGLVNELGLRRSALALLGLLPSKMKESIILPPRHAVTRKLLAALDDRKRHVRKAAVDCRAAWLGLDHVDDET